MKKLFSLFFLMVIFVTSSFAVGNYYPGVVHFKDGHNESYESIVLPKSKYKILSVSDAMKPKRKEMKDIQVADIEAITVWHPEHPDIKYTIYHVFAKSKVGNGAEDQWGNIIASSSWGFAVKCYDMFTIAYNGQMIGYINTYGDIKLEYTYLVRLGYNEKSPAIFTQVGWYANPSQYFEEKPEIAQQIKKKKLKPADIQYILDEMAGTSAGDNEPDVITTNQESDSTDQTNEEVINGTIGDDE